MTEDQRDAIEDMKVALESTRIAIELLIELFHDQHQWTAEAFRALGVEVVEMNPPPKSQVLRLVHGFKGKRVPPQGPDNAA